VEKPQLKRRNYGTDIKLRRGCFFGKQSEILKWSVSKRGKKKYTPTGSAGTQSATRENTFNRADGKQLVERPPPEKAKGELVSSRLRRIKAQKTPKKKYGISKSG